MNVVGYAFEEAWASVRRAGRSAAVSIGTIAIAFLTLGGFMLVSVNVQRVLDRWLESAEVPVYLYDDLSDELRSELATYVRQQPAVAAEEPRRHRDDDREDPEGDEELEEGDPAAPHVPKIGAACEAMRGHQVSP